MSQLLKSYRWLNLHFFLIPRTSSAMFFTQDPTNWNNHKQPNGQILLPGIIIFWIRPSFVHTWQNPWLPRPGVGKAIINAGTVKLPHHPVLVGHIYQDLQLSCVKGHEPDVQASNQKMSVKQSGNEEVAKNVAFHLMHFQVSKFAKHVVQVLSGPSGFKIMLLAPK